MPESWATSVDLHLDLAPARGRPALERALRDAVRSGRLAPGTRLPSSRALAADLRVARNSVAETYGQLVAEGWLEARQGSGTRVASRVPVSPPAPVPTAPRRQPRHSLRPGSPDLSSFPRTAWLAASRRALASAPAEALGYSDPRGRPELRRALADYLARARGVHADPGRIVVCGGFAQGLGLLCDVLRAGGARSLATEAWCQSGTRSIVADRGLELSTVPVDESGARLDPSPEAGGADAVLLTPAHQFPLGGVLAAERRTAAVHWAVATGGLLIEDDYDGEFRYDRHPVGALQGLAPDRVVYAGTASKTLAPGLRLGWLVLPAPLLEPVVAAKVLADRQHGALDQLAMAAFVDSGGYDRHVRRRRLAYRGRRDRLVAALAEHAPRARVTGVAAGLHALVHLPPGRTEAEVVAAAARRGLALEPLGLYATGSATHPPALVVGYGTPPDHDFATAVNLLCAVLA
ncbi:MAG TPA: PLP-dependent aminotransferase family protein [Mycobacteriales bacterium]